MKMIPELLLHTTAQELQTCHFRARQQEHPGQQKRTTSTPGLHLTESSDLTPSTISCMQISVLNGTPHGTPSGLNASRAHDRTPNVHTRVPRFKHTTKIPRADTAMTYLGQSHFGQLKKKASSASNMTAAQVMGVIARLPDCAGQASDAVFVCTQVKLEDVPRLLRIPMSENPDMWPESSSNIENTVFHFAHSQHFTMLVV